MRHEYRGEIPFRSSGRDGSLIFSGRRGSDLDLSNAAVESLCAGALKLHGCTFVMSEVFGKPVSFQSLILNGGAIAQYARLKSTKKYDGESRIDLTLSWMTTCESTTDLKTSYFAELWRDLMRVLKDWGFTSLQDSGLVLVKVHRNG